MVIKSRPKVQQRGAVELFEGAKGKARNGEDRKYRRKSLLPPGRLHEC